MGFDKILTYLKQQSVMKSQMNDLNTERDDAQKMVELLESNVLELEQKLVTQNKIATKQVFSCYIILRLQNLISNFFLFSSFKVLLQAND